MLGLIFAGIYIAREPGLHRLLPGGERRSEFNPLKHVVVPILGVIAMIPALLAVIGGVTIPILDITWIRTRTRCAGRRRSSASGSLLGMVAYFVLRSRDPGGARARRATSTAARRQPADEEATA